MREGWEALARAIVLQACGDYRTVRKQLQKLQEGEPKNGDVHLKMRYGKRLDQMKADFGEVIGFFCSDWFGQLTTVNPEYLLDQLNKECDSK